MRETKRKAKHEALLLKREAVFLEAEGALHTLDAGKADDLFGGNAAAKAEAQVQLKGIVLESLRLFLCACWDLRQHSNGTWSSRKRPRSRRRPPPGGG